MTGEKHTFRSSSGSSRSEIIPDAEVRRAVAMIDSDSSKQLGDTETKHTTNEKMVVLIDFDKQNLISQTNGKRTMCVQM